MNDDAPDAGPDVTAGSIILRPTTEFDLDWVVRTEHDPDIEAFVTRWTRQRHSAALRDPATRHFTITDATGQDRLGYVILRDVGNVDASIELLRIVVARRGAGIGRAALRLVKRMVFDELGAHRLWLDVVPSHAVARRLYESEGFVQEGIMREAGRRPSGYVSLLLMSILEQEYRGD
jgi:diamine N-acetyltransferase